MDSPDFRARILRLTARGRPRKAPSAEDEARRSLFGAALLLAFDLLADARALAGELAHVVELRAAHVAFALELDRGDQRRVGLKRSLDALARGHLAHGERGVDAATLLGDHHAFVSLQALALAFDDAHVDDHGVARGE